MRPSTKRREGLPPGRGLPLGAGRPRHLPGVHRQVTASAHRCIGSRRRGAYRRRGACSGTPRARAVCGCCSGARGQAARHREQMAWISSPGCGSWRRVSGAPAHDSWRRVSRCLVAAPGVLLLGTVSSSYGIRLHSAVAKAAGDRRAQATGPDCTTLPPRLSLLARHRGRFHLHLTLDVKASLLTNTAVPYLLARSPYHRARRRPSPILSVAAIWNIFQY